MQINKKEPIHVHRSNQSYLNVLHQLGSFSALVFALFNTILNAHMLIVNTFTDRIFLRNVKKTKTYILYFFFNPKNCGHQVGARRKTSHYRYIIITTPTKKTAYNTSFSFFATQSRTALGFSPCTRQ